MHVQNSQAGGQGESPEHPCDTEVRDGGRRRVGSTADQRSDVVREAPAQGSYELVQNLKPLTPRPSHYVIKADVAEFFNSGTEAELVKDVGSLFASVEPERKSAFESALTMLLQNQFVRSECFPDVFKVVRGSGMGHPTRGKLLTRRFSKEQKRITSFEIGVRTPVSWHTGALKTTY